MKKPDQKTGESRRGFLKLMSVSAPAAAVSAVTATEADAAEPVEEGSGLRMTAHVKAYLDSARF
ncbi:twin-arginine translocation pathway signal protein [Ovoidimarina sediminis]|uniref:twin-arginine translocation pathway signal protein n=1 Tax=Ovoidimarina sediminis TaxID=3079856 RepID=UPI0029088551|nr:twin-arginine translocation pathway signal protein [Rhodophyticola sp. MJ-SS7]MDU8942052.1 twin-arginine translocation pathway signal protein [Rhodophyticola sp. MJ-SS7]